METVEDKIRQQIKKISASENHDTRKIAVPFVPYVGDNYAQAKHKILVVGKATYGWKCKDESGNNSESLADINLEDSEWWYRLKEAPKHFIEERVLPFYAGRACRDLYHSLFWNRIYRILGTLLSDKDISKYERNESTSQTVFRSFAWTNVFKLAARKGNPPKQLIDSQIAHNSLPEEIDQLKPDVVLFFTGPSYDKHLCKIFPSMRFKDSGSIKEIQGVSEHTKVILRTYHPQYYKFDVEEVTNLIQKRLYQTE